MSCEVKTVLMSKNASTGAIIHSVQARYWRAIHAELMTHRAFSRNAGSSRAQPVKKVLAQVWSDPAGPIHWGKNQAGMQAREELTGWRRLAAKALWRLGAKLACAVAWGLMKLKLHKQVANRVLEPYQYINVLITATDWDNFFNLRRHPDAQPEIQELADAIYRERERSLPMAQALLPGQWHLPYVTPGEQDSYPINLLLKLSTARCARVSYEPFDGNASITREVERHDSLVGSEPIHASPTEHQAKALTFSMPIRNFSGGFAQYRTIVEKAISGISTGGEKA